MTINVSPKKLQSICAALPGTRSEIAERAGASKSTTSNSLTLLMQAGKAHIGAWKYTGPDGRMAPVYFAGHGITPPKPPAKNAYRRKEKAEPDAANLLPRVDPMIWATAGRAAPEVRV